MKKNYKKTLKLLGLLSILTFSLFLVIDYFFPLKVERDYSCSIYDINGTLAHSFLSDDDKWRLFCELSEISDQLKTAVLFKEDKYFYYHPGINLFAISRAIFNNIVQHKRTSGASTITMQAARLLEPKERTYSNKMLEMFKALQLEWHFSKDEILQLYLNLIPMGGNIEGIKAASYIYFNKSPNYLSLAETTALSVIPNRPVSLRLGRANHLITEVRNKWLNRFAKDELFSSEEIADALTEPLIASRLEMPRKLPHLSLRLKQSYPGKKNIRSTVDLNMQHKIENLVKTYSHQLYFKGIYNATVLVLDNKTRQVRSYIGSADFNSNIDGGQVDGIVATRSPGSTLKPFLYALAMDKGMITPKRKILDIPTYFNNYEPENYDGKFYGEVSVEFALINSLNVPAVRVLDKTGVDDFVKLLGQSGFHVILSNKERLGLSVVLGGCGVTLEELTTAYCALANLGAFTNAKYIVEDSIFNIDTVLSPASAYAISEILTKLTRPDLPVEWRNTVRMPKIAWKTGTSYGRRDAWSIGFNDEYTIGVWCGNFSGKGIPDLSGSEVATPLLLRIFNAIDKNQHEWLIPPDDLDFRIVCANSGMVPGNNCENQTIDYYIPQVSSIKKCEHLKHAWINSDSALSYCSKCLPENGYKKILIPNYSPELLSYYHTFNIPFVKTPAHNPKCEALQDNDAPMIISPINGMDYLLAESDTAQLMLSCKTSAEVKKVYWSINNQFVKSGAASSELYITPPEGHIKISCSDDLGRNTNAEITVKYIAF